MTEPASEKFIVRDPQGNIFGPADADMLRRWVTEGRIVPGMAIAPRDTSDWTEASIHPATAELLQQRIRQIMETQSLRAAPAHTTVTYSQTDPAITYAPPTYPNALGIISFIAGIIAVVGAFGSPFSCICPCLMPVSGLFALVAVTLGAMGVWQVKTNPARYTGRGVAVAGLAMGTITLLIYVTILLVVGIRMLTGPP